MYKRQALSSASSPEQDIVILNSAAALVTIGLAGNLSSGIELSREVIISGAARDKVAQLAEFTQGIA